MTVPFGAAVDPDAAREQAEEILSDRRFDSDSVPRPFRGFLEWVGDRVEWIPRRIGDVVEMVPGFVWLALAVALAIAAVVLIVRASVRRRSRVAMPWHAFDGRPSAEEDPAALERAADEAERAGDLDGAVRLRFRAGLVRLGRGGAIDYRPSVTVGEVRRALGSTSFDELARTFERVAYGDDDATTTDVESARRTWPGVLEEAARR